MQVRCLFLSNSNPLSHPVNLDQFSLNLQRLLLLIVVDFVLLQKLR